MINKNIKAVKPDVESIINTLLPDNSSGAITPNILRDVLHKMSLVMQDNHAALYGGGFLTAGTGIITHYTTAENSPFFDAWTDPAMGSIGITAPYDKVVVDGSIYYEVTGSGTYRLGYAIDGVKSEMGALLSSGRNNMQFRLVVDNPAVNKDIQLCITPLEASDISKCSLIKIDMHVYGIKVGKNVK